MGSNVTVWVIASQWAVSVMLEITGNEKSYSESPTNQPMKVYPSLTGSSGLTTDPPSMTLLEDTDDPPSESNVTV